MSLKLLYSWFKRKLGLISLKTLLHRQTETTVSNKNECITKITTDETATPRFAKLQSKINTITCSINTIDSTSVEHNSKKTGAEYIQHLPQYLILSQSDLFALIASRHPLSLFRLSDCDLASV